MVSAAIAKTGRRDNTLFYICGRQRLGGGTQSIFLLLDWLLKGAGIIAKIPWTVSDSGAVRQAQGAQKRQKPDLESWRASVTGRNKGVYRC